MCKHLTIILLSLPLLLISRPGAAQEGTLFNFDWKFRPGAQENAASPSLDDSSWRGVDLPHDFQFEQPWDPEASRRRGFKPSCEGWYRKRFDASGEWKGKKVYLDFDGIMYVSDVYINGEKVASGEYGYVGYDADISDHLNYDKPNVVAVYASTGHELSSRWYTGGGIFRDVYLKVKNPTHIVRHGIFVHTPEVSREKASVAIQVEVEGYRGHDVSIRATVVSPDGEALGTAEAECSKLTKVSCLEVPLPTVEITRPRLWSPDSPSLYGLDVEVWADGTLSDKASESFGIRKVEFSKEQGFLLNGEKLFLKGVANHHDLGALGAASYDTAIERLFMTLKQFGFNSVRCSHSPYSREFTRIADRMGILVVDELIDKWSTDSMFWGGRIPFSDYWYRMIPEWIKRDRNCPSVILWSLGNELQYTERFIGFPTGDWGVTGYRMMDVLVKRYDPTRKTTVAMFPSRSGGISYKDPEADWNTNPPELATVTDVASFNYQWTLYPEFLKHAPNMIIYQSEATTRELLMPYFGMDREKMVGLAWWGAVEYWGESDGWPKKGWNYSYFSHTLEPYPQAWLIKSALEPSQPVVRVAVPVDGKAEQMWNDILVGRQNYVSHWNFPAGSRHNVAVFTNAEEAELFLNGKSLGRKPNDNSAPEMRNVIVWQDVPYGKGGSLEAVGYNAGKAAARHKVETAGKAVRLKVEAESSQGWKGDGMGLRYLKVRAVDKKGRVVPGFDEALSVSVEGAATLLALDNGDHYTDELFHGVDCKHMKDGFMLVILRSIRGQEGPVKVKLFSPSLKTTVDL